MRIFFKTVSSFLEANIFTSDNGVLVLFCLLKIMSVQGHQESDFQTSFYALECYKDVPPDCTKIATDTSGNKLSENIGW